MAKNPGPPREIRRGRVGEPAVPALKLEPARCQLRVGWSALGLADEAARARPDALDRPQSWTLLDVDARGDVPGMSVLVGSGHHKRKVGTRPRRPQLHQDIGAGLCSPVGKRRGDAHRGRRGEDGGRGKTIVRHVELGLYPIDLPDVGNKYIGETRGTSSTRRAQSSATEASARIRTDR